MAPPNKPKPNSSETQSLNTSSSFGINVNAQACHEEKPIKFAAALETIPAYPERSSEEQARVVIPNPYQYRSDKGAGITLSENHKLGRMQLIFDEKPTDRVRMVLREEGFTLNSPNGAWEVAVDREQSWTARAAADKAFQRVTELIRQERGLSAEVS